MTGDANAYSLSGVWLHPAYGDPGVGKCAGGVAVDYVYVALLIKRDDAAASVADTVIDEAYVLLLSATDDGSADIAGTSA